MKARIIERTAPDGRKSYVIQQRHWLFRWRWCDAWIYSLYGAVRQNSFSTLEEARRILCWFDGTPFTERVMPNATPRPRKTGPLNDVYRKFKHLDRVLREFGASENPMYRAAAEMWDAIAKAMGVPDPCKTCTDRDKSDDEDPCAMCGPPAWEYHDCRCDDDAPTAEITVKGGDK